MSAVDVPTAREGAAATTKTDASEELQQLYRRYHGHVFHLALRYGGGSVAWAEDVTHDVFVQLLTKRVRLGLPEDLYGWFYRVTTRRCLNRLRHEALLQSAPIRWLLSQKQCVPTPESEVVVADELEHVARVVRRLPAKERVAFYMRHVDGKAQVEIAQVMGHSTGYVSKLLTRARGRLAAEGWEVSDGD